MAPQATVMNANGNTLPPNTGPRPSVNCVSGGIRAGGCIARIGLRCWTRLRRTLAVIPRAIEVSIVRDDPADRRVSMSFVEGGERISRFPGIIERKPLEVDNALLQDGQCGEPFPGLPVTDERPIERSDRRWSPNTEATPDECGLDDDLDTRGRTAITPEPHDHGTERTDYPVQPGRTGCDQDPTDHHGMSRRAIAAGLVKSNHRQGTQPEHRCDQKPVPSIGGGRTVDCDTDGHQ